MANVFFYFFFLFLCNAAAAADIPLPHTKDYYYKLVVWEKKQLFPSIHPPLMIDSFRYTRTQLDSIDPPTTPLPSSPPITNPVTPPPTNSPPGVVTVPGANPPPVTNPVNPPPVTNPVNPPPVTNPVNPPPITNPVNLPPLPNPPPITNPVNLPPLPNPPPITNPVNPPPVTNPVNPPPVPNPVNPPPVTNPVNPPPVPNPPPVTNPVNPPPTNNVNPAAPVTTPTGSGGNGRWCIAKNGASQAVLQSALDYACGVGGADCATIQQGGSCYEPASLENHASYAFNSYYQKNPAPTSCDFGGAAVLTTTNPSTGSCVYPSSSSSPFITQTPANSTSLPRTPPATSSSGQGTQYPPPAPAAPGFSLGSPNPTGLGAYGASPPLMNTVSNSLQPFIGSLVTAAAAAAACIIMFGL